MCMTHVSDVARYILERQGPVTTLKLQKLVYYVQAWAIAKGEPLISDTVKAWVQGPVVPSLYQQHKGLRQIAASNMTIRGRGLTDQDRAHIDSVLAYYGAMPPSYLKKLTHFERPWREARAEGERRGHASPAITVAALRSFYSGRTPEELEADFQMTVAREVMDQHKQCLARLAL
jgi:uncharacterized phage-associated protein